MSTTASNDGPHPVVVARRVISREDATENSAQRAALDGLSATETTILVIDHHRSFADLLARALNGVSGMRCVGTAATASEGIALAGKLQPDTVVLDIRMPGQDGLHTIRMIRETAPDTAVAVVTEHCDHIWISRAAQAGASAFIV